jgi:hypothetical protein
MWQNYYPYHESWHQGQHPSNFLFLPWDNIQQPTHPHVPWTFPPVFSPNHLHHPHPPQPLPMGIHQPHPQVWVNGSYWGNPHMVSSQHPHIPPIFQFQLPPIPLSHSSSSRHGIHDTTAHHEKGLYVSTRPRERSLVSRSKPIVPQRPRASEPIDGVDFYNSTLWRQNNIYNSSHDLYKAIDGIIVPPLSSPSPAPWKPTHGHVYC